MGTTIKCEKCGNYSIEVIGDRELDCEICLNKEIEDDDIQ